MASQRIAIACALRGYIQIYAITTFGLDEIAPKNFIPEHSPIKSLTACDTLGIFTTLNTLNEIMVDKQRSLSSNARSFVVMDSK